MTEFSPPSRWTARITKKQLKKMQENYRKAAELAEDFEEKEKLEKKQEVEKLEKKLEDMF